MIIEPPKLGGGYSVRRHVEPRRYTFLILLIPRHLAPLFEASVMFNLTILRAATVRHSGISRLELPALGG